MSSIPILACILKVKILLNKLRPYKITSLPLLVQMDGGSDSAENISTCIV